ncbi:uncharacterized protein PADG_11765 [Paracoccidioides brasiliensis Pb18]|uniref:NADH dehydrogenase [ubiquinone] 1 alpha subcomplex assembly factor 3 n=1 Tax=Paracoccidioides brasiliensis (strain Pb18) TaxID=502780 RepID=A0A0A0HUI2_PARBD|nr:uncharacterized protein PADG_11765 [Paracoccidioides brasiliensis Pb18]KGM92227.1 hypothetical protein PADG_11765 [Paracoccidioides brasiliensis Pb18]
MRPPSSRLLRVLRPSARTQQMQTPQSGMTITTSPSPSRSSSSSLQPQTHGPLSLRVSAPDITSQHHSMLRNFYTTSSSLNNNHSNNNIKPQSPRSNPQRPNPSDTRTRTRTRTPTPTPTPIPTLSRTPHEDKPPGSISEDITCDPSLFTRNVLMDVAGPSTAVDACLPDGFHLNNGVKITGGDGCLLVDGEVLAWRPWEAGKGENGRGMAAMINEKGQWEVDAEVWGVLRLIRPKPDLLILGLGASVHPLSPETRRQINLLGIRVEVQDTRNAAAQFNLLATERGVREVTAALIPVGWKGP